MENQITRLFAEKGVKISTFARINGISYGTLYDIISGRTPIERVKIGTFVKIANGFGMTIDELLGDPRLDLRRYEIDEIYGDLPELGKRELHAIAETLHDVHSAEADEAIYEQRSLDDQ